MSFPIGYDPTALIPSFLIRNLQGSLIASHTANKTEQTYADPITGEEIILRKSSIQLQGGHLSCGINTDHGTLDILIRDDEYSLIDLLSRVKDSTIKLGWEIQLFFNKEGNPPVRWFTGIINNIQHIIQNRTKVMKISAYGWGFLLASTYTNIQRTQRRLLDGITQDSGDNSTLISEIFKDLIRDTDHLSTDTPLPITLGEIETIPVALAEYKKNFVTVGSVANELSQMAAGYWGVNADKQIFMRKRNSHSSGFLISNDLDEPTLITKNWDKSRQAFIKIQEITRDDSIKDSGFLILHGLGSRRNRLLTNYEEPDSGLNLATASYISTETALGHNIGAISILIEKSSAQPLSQNLDITIYGHNNGIDFNNILGSRSIPFGLLEKLLAGGTRDITVIFDPPIETQPGQRFYVQIHQNGGDLLLRYKLNTGSYRRILNGVVGFFTGSISLRTYETRSITLTGQNTSLKNTLRQKEGIVTLPDSPDETTAVNIFESILESKGRIISNYNPIKISPFDLPPPLGQTIRVIDIQSDLDYETNIVGYDLPFSSYDESALGVYEMTITLQEVYN